MNKPGSFGIGTWNLDWARRSEPHAYAQVLADHPCDVWVLTETRDEISPPKFAHSVSAAVRPRDDRRKWTPTSRWVTIWSRWRMSAVTTEMDDGRTACARVAGPDGQKLLVYGTVLPWSADVLYRTKGEKMSAIARQFEDCRRLLAKNDDCRLVIAGDFNQFMAPQKSRETETLQGAIEIGLRNLGMICVTAPSLLGRQVPHQSIDHIAVPAAIADRFASADAWPSSSKLSDHGGIVIAGVKPHSLTLRRPTR